MRVIPILPDEWEGVKQNSDYKDCHQAANNFLDCRSGKLVIEFVDANPGKDVCLCTFCGQVKGSDKCCKEGAEKCSKCGLDKGSPGCCRIKKETMSA